VKIANDIPGNHSFSGPAS